MARYRKQDIGSKGRRREDRKGGKEENGGQGERGRLLVF